MTRTARPRTRMIVAAGALALVIVAAFIAASVEDSGRADGSGSRSVATAVADAHGFLARYVAPSGRVIRRDQGGDTVSEGQAYGMLLAEAAGEPATFRRIWGWTRRHLQDPDGLLGYHASSSGVLEDATPAADADLLSAWALARARGPGTAALHAQARRIAGAILHRETIRWHGLLILAAGPWATGSPGSLDPSYWAPEAFAALGRLTGDRRWRALAASSVALSTSLAAGGRRLPPDWAKLTPSAATAEPAPNGTESQTRYGLDAQRLVVWLAAGCGRAERRLAAHWWHLLAAPGRAEAIALDPASGAVIDGQTNALPPVAAAAAASAAGDARARDRLLARARATQAAHPTYYGGAWLALGALLLDTGRLGGCAIQGGNG